MSDPTPADPADVAVDPAPGDPASDETGTDEPRPGRRRWLRRTLITLGALSLVLTLVIGGGLWYLTNRYGGNIERVTDVFDGLDDASRPAAPSPTAVNAPAAEPVTFLLVGSDTREDLAPGELPDARSDAIMIARFSGDRQHAQVISIPRDSWVDIPGRGQAKINAAYAYGGPTLLIQTVEQLTGVRIDHYAAIDFDGLTQVTDALGGLDVVVPETTTWGPYTFTAGVNHLDGEAARWYVGQRHGLPGGDFDRVKRQQNYLRAMFTQLFSQDVFTSPGKLDETLLAVTSAVAVDDGLSNADLLSLAYSLRGLTPSTVQFFTAPVLGTGTEGTASVVYLDRTTGERMWGYLNTDSLSQNADEFADEALPAVTN
ncbi:LCP family protein [Modestobacter versicolor]|uniref:LCP family protein required for cell wall assembly n=1 Tax=Modestobacter versicolor TaxID=429133 RepID=A0A323VE03_9ACTN|nr:LCP family protein [Modestobacter versicolor]MBB3676988.1 LCP family protein required for cell wall assembly [Modestobacter versicolor]PZA22967.1 LytR family transcriptional regulator [Modestobacter versicolor]